MRGGDREKVAMDQAEAEERKRSSELVALDDALTSLAEVDERKAQVVELKYFGRLTNEEVAGALDVSLATVKRDWDANKAWLFKQLNEESSA